jgi:hypothetical protein
MNTNLESEDRVDAKASTVYAQIFRIIASALEKLQVESFDLEIKHDEYYIRGYAKTDAANPALGRERSNNFAGAWRKIRNRFFPQPPGVSFELHYTPENLRDLELAGRSQRGSSPGYPHAQSLTETLRSVGGFLDSKQARLSRLSMRGRWITMHYKSPQGHLVVEEHTAISLHNFWVSMCARRANAVQISASPGRRFRVDPDEQN